MAQELRPLVRHHHWAQSLPLVVSLAVDRWPDHQVKTVTASREQHQQSQAHPLVTAVAVAKAAFLPLTLPALVPTVGATVPAPTTTVVRAVQLIAAAVAAVVALMLVVMPLVTTVALVWSLLLTKSDDPVSDLDEFIAPTA
jgi:hypothetical protein